MAITLAQRVGRALHSRLAVGLSAGLAGIAISGGIASATIPDANNVFTACFDSITGILRIIDTDPSTPHIAALPCAVEQTITWNQQGIQGIQGPQGLVGPPGINGTIGQKGDIGLTGPKGDVGPVGLQGPSHTWITRQSDQARTTLTSDYTDIQALQLAPGSYVLTGKVTIENGDVPTETIGCELRMADQILDKSGAVIQGHNIQTIAVQGALVVPATVGSPTPTVPVSLSCAADHSSAFNAVLSATQVQDLNPSPGAKR